MSDVEPTPPNSTDSSPEESTAPADGAVAGAEPAEEKPTFDAFPLDARILKAVSDLGFKHPTPIQVASMRPLLSGKDVIGGARTGSGKTAAFGLPLLETVKDSSQREPKGLILAPTRELAVQVTEALQTFAKHLPVKLTTIYGGASYDNQFRALKKGVTIVVGTPGRVIDHLDRGSLDLSKIEFLVLDEADEMLRMGFIEPVEKVLAALPEQRQIALFSATMPPPIARVAKKYLKDPVDVQVEDTKLHVDHIEQRALVVSHRDKIDALCRVLAAEPRGTTLVFARTRLGCAEVADELAKRGVSADALHGDLNQAARERVLARMRSGRLDVVIATDVAARGIDVEHITHVINLQLPDDAEIYVHRIGRTGRAGRKGVAISFVTERERHRLKNFQRQLKVEITGMEVPSDAEIVAVQKRRLTSTLEEDLEVEPTAFELAGEWWDALVDGREARSVGVALLAKLAAGEGIDLAKRPSDQPPHYARRRGERADRPPREERPPRGSYAELELFIPLGKRNGIVPGDIVGALANEGGIPGGFIGRINMLPFKTFVSVEAEHARRVLKDHPDIELRGQTVKMGASNGPPPREGGQGPRGGNAGGGDRESRRPRKPYKERDARPRGDGPRPTARKKPHRGRPEDRGPVEGGEVGPHGARPENAPKRQRADRPDRGDRAPDRSPDRSGDRRPDGPRRGPTEGRPAPSGKSGAGRWAPKGGTSRGPSGPPGGMKPPRRKSKKSKGPLK